MATQTGKENTFKHNDKKTRARAMTTDKIKSRQSMERSSKVSLSTFSVLLRIHVSLEPGKYVSCFINTLQESADVIQRDVANHILMEDASLDVYQSLFQIELVEQTHETRRKCECRARN